MPAGASSFSKQQQAGASHAAAAAANSPSAWDGEHRRSVSGWERIFPTSLASHQAAQAFTREMQRSKSSPSSAAAMQQHFRAMVAEVRTSEKALRDELRRIKQNNQLKQQQGVMAAKKPAGAAVDACTTGGAGYHAARQLRRW